MNEDQFMLIILTLIALSGIVMYWIGRLTTPKTSEDDK